MIIFLLKLPTVPAQAAGKSGGSSPPPSSPQRYWQIHYCMCKTISVCKPRLRGSEETLSEKRERRKEEAGNVEKLEKKRKKKDLKRGQMDTSKLRINKVDVEITGGEIKAEEERRYEVWERSGKEA